MHETFQQQGYSTDLILNSQGKQAFTHDYTGMALRNLYSKYKQMLCISGSSPQRLKRLYNLAKLFSNENDLYYSDVDKLPLLDTPIVSSSVNELFSETINIVKRHNITACLTHTKTQSALTIGTNPTIEKSLEFIALTLEGNDNPNESRCLVDIRPSVGGFSLTQIKNASNWLIQRRKLTKSLPPGKFPIVLAPGIGGILIHEVIGHQFELSKSFSAYSPVNFEKGHRLFSSNLTVVDAPFSLMPPESFDDEGTIKKKTILIKNGAVNSPLTDRHSAHTHPSYTLTGNGRRGSYLHFPESRMYNTYVENGADSPSNAISGIEYGFYVIQISYANCRHLTGDVKICVGRAYIIRHGKITDHPATFIVEDNVSSFFNAKHVCNDFVLLPGYCHSTSGGLYIEHGSPTLGFGAVNIKSGFIHM